MSKESIVLGWIRISSYKSSSPIWPQWLRDPKDFPEYVDLIKEIDPKEVILPKGKYELKIDYPLSNPYETMILCKDPGITRRMMINLIVGCYREIYKTEDSSATIDPNQENGMLLNRVKTNGQYGIWGHVIEDLSLHRLYVNGNKLTLGVDS